jgi:hypothetical protein
MDPFDKETVKNWFLARAGFSQTRKVLAKTRRDLTKPPEFDGDRIINISVAPLRRRVKLFASLRETYFTRSPRNRNNSVSASFVLYLAAINLL